MQKCFSTLLADPGAAIGAVIHDRVAGGVIHESYIDYLKAAHQATGKPAALVANARGSGSDALAAATTRAGFPVLDGVPQFLRGVKCLLDHRDRQARGVGAAPAPPAAALSNWRARLGDGARLDEHDALKMLRDMNLPANPSRLVESESAASQAARELGYPVVLKTAARGADHKTELDGVRLDLADETALLRAYRDVERRLGPRMLVAPMIRARGVEMLLGMVNDAQFGPVVVLGAGGIHVEALRDVLHALPPFDAAHARRLVAKLKCAPLLTSRRHARPLAIDSFCEAAARFSAVVAALGDRLEEVDLNPVIVHPEGCVIVDALVLARGVQAARQAS
jgi:acyl-CoA synthetase (NDP forming)